MAGMLLTVFDYVVFALLLLVSLGIGVFYSFRQKTSSEYLHGNHKMTLLPVSVSLVVSYISALTMQGLPAEVYVHGIGIIFAIFAIWGIILVAFTFLPIYFYYKPTSVFEYLEMRYKSSGPKLVASFMMACSQTIYCGFILFGPAAAIESMSSIPTGYSIICIAVVCTIYTSIGGLRGVIWTDVFQALIMIMGFLMVIIMGCTKIGVSALWEELEKHGRTHINFNPTVTVRNSFWICLVFMGVQWHSLFISQIAMVRYTSLPTIRQARLSIVFGGIGVVLLMILAVCAGAVVFAYYSRTGCDPLVSGDVYTSNQVLPYFVVNVLNYPGIPGLFLAATVASTLSSMSSAQTSIVAIVWKDIVCRFVTTSEFRKTIILKIIVVIVGAIAVIIAFITKYAGETLYNLGFAVLDVIQAPFFGMFILGAICSYSSVWGAIIGCLTSMAFVSWVSIGRLIHGTNWAAPDLVMSSCNQNALPDDINWNFTTTRHNDLQFTWLVEITSNMNEVVEDVNDSSDSLIGLYSLSSYANPVLAIGITVIVGIIVSLIPGLRYQGTVDKHLLFPCVRRFMGNLSKEDKVTGEELEKLKRSNDL